MRTRFGIAQDEAGTASSPVLNAVAAPSMAAPVVAPAEVSHTRSAAASTSVQTRAFNSAGAAGINAGSAPDLSEVMSYTFNNGHYEYSGNPLIDGILIGSRWTPEDGVITYSFPTSGSFYGGSYYDSGYLTGHTTFNAQQQWAAEYAFKLIAGYTGLTFQKVEETASNHAMIRLSQTTDSSLAGAEGNVPSSYPWGGDIWFRAWTNEPFLTDPRIGNWGMATMMHEIGHALGLKHGHEDLTTTDLTQGGLLDGPGPHYGTDSLPTDDNGWVQSLMTYSSIPRGGTTFEGDQYNQPQTYMRADIQALQFLYGAGFNYNAGDNYYQFNSTTGEMVVYTVGQTGGISQGVPENETFYPLFSPSYSIGKIFRTVWDGGGVDCYDFSTATTAVYIDLRPGGTSVFSQRQLAELKPLSDPLHHDAYFNVANAVLYNDDPRSLIEAAIGANGHDIIRGNQADNWFDGRGGNDTIDGGLGNDTYWVNYYYSTDLVIENPDEGTDLIRVYGSYTLTANVEDLTVMGGGNVTATGNGLNNVITNDYGTFTLIGGAGNDTYVVSGTGDVLVEQANEGIDTVEAKKSHVLAANIENLTLLGSDTISGTGNDLGNRLSGNSADNVLTGAAGNDTYVVQNAGDSIVEAAGAGTDTVESALTRTLETNVENLVLTGTDAINGTGNTSNNALTGNSGNNSLDGAAGADTLNGGLGDDTYYVDNASDNVTEAHLQGTDTVISSVTYSLSGRAAENLTLTGTGALNGTGNSLGNTLNGNAGANLLDGGTGSDTLAGGAGNDTYIVDSIGDTVAENASAGTDTVQSGVTFSLGSNIENLLLTGTSAVNGTGNSLANSLTGNTAANSLDGGTGNDTLTGGAGNDTYIVNVTTDVVVEAAGEGLDEVQAGASWTLGADFENLVLTGGSVISGTGNALANKLTGNTTTNALTGGAGNDTYYIQNTSDTTVELAGEGTDFIVSSVSWTLAANTENLTLTGTANLSGTGNELDNVLTGNSGNNILRGGLGNDIYYIQNAGDSVEEAHLEGTADQIVSTVSYSLFGRAVEVLILTGSDNTNATGNSLYNSLHGSSGDNILDGAGGDDHLKGNLGADTFLFQLGSGADTIKDFSATQNDSINVNAYTAGVANSGMVAQSGANVLIALGGINSITVENATTADVLAHMVW